MIIIEIFRKNGFILLLPDQTQFWNFLGKRYALQKLDLQINHQMMVLNTNIQF